MSQMVEYMHVRLVIKLFTSESLKKEDGHVKQRDKVWLISSKNWCEQIIWCELNHYVCSDAFLNFSLILNTLYYL